MSNPIDELKTDGQMTTDLHATESTPAIVDEENVAPSQNTLSEHAADQDADESPATDKQKEPTKEKTPLELAQKVLASIKRLTGEEDAANLVKRATNWEETVNVIDSHIHIIREQAKMAKGIQQKLYCAEGIKLLKIRNKIQVKITELETGHLSLTAEDEAFIYG